MGNKNSPTKIVAAPKPEKQTTLTADKRPRID